MKLHRIAEKDDSSDALYEAIALIKTLDEAKKFLQDLCTPTELQAMADRWRVVALIKKNIPYRQIYEETKVSVTTVGRVARSIQMGEGGYNLLYDRVEKARNKK
jgi:TrpR-related protein YerC/YecD